MNRISGNRSELILRRGRRAYIKQMYTDALHYHSGRFEDRIIPPEVLLQIKSEIRTRIKRERRSQIRRAAALTAMVIFLLAGVVTLVSCLL